MGLHPGEAAAQRRMGVTRDGWGSAGVAAEIPPVAAEFLSGQRLLVLGSADDGGAMWADAVVGPPGFATPVGTRSIAVDRRPALLAPLFAAGTREIGMLAIEPPTRRRMRVNGTASGTGDGLLIRTEQVYANCPKYIQTREFVDTVDGRGPGAARTGRTLTSAQREWIERSDTFFIATHAAGQGADVSHRGGNPGFVRAAGADRLVWPEYVGNSMYMTLGNLELDPACGLLFIDWEKGHTLHLTGRARVDWAPDERAESLPGARQVIDFDVERVVELPGALPGSWEFGEYHRFNPKIVARG
ncbi:pyridoxamine 5'-phosphate oxidase family protein [Spirillospora sp. NPDC048911]|uniref:pyridoxamine 5'-phosphate oxidase family protein n=1 Tax=Spirillospora sp. NPDC048911 TaxID=3364527 RepID=UPI003716220D